MIFEEQQIHDQILDLKHKISDQNLELLPDYKFRINVLEHYNFINAESIVQLKGRVACEVILSLLLQINTADELLLTELLVDNFFADFNPAETVALLSCLVFQEKTQSDFFLTPQLESVFLSFITQGN